MIKKALVALLISLLLLGSNSCSIITGDFGATPEDEASGPLSLMLRAVPSTGTITLMYNNLTILSTYENVVIPSRQTSRQEKLDWWASIQDYILYGYPAPVVTEIWGFDVVNVAGMLTWWGDGLVTILSGDLDTDAFRRKLLSYGYKETTYLGSPVFTGIPEPNEDFDLGILPQGFGIINGAGTGDETTDFILMTEPGGNNIEFARQSIEAAIAAYRQKTSLADKPNSLTKLAAYVGEAGAAFITSDTLFTLALEHVTAAQAEWMREAAGPGKLDPYGGMGITYRKDGNNQILEFILDYNDGMAAATNAATLEERLSESRSLMFDMPFGQIWDILEVVNDGPFLRATASLRETVPQEKLFFVVLVYTLDFWFLYPES
jgi:hypothetical protein